MLRARWIVPLILVVPLAAPAPADEVVEGRASTMPEEARAPDAFPTTLRPFDDGISRATSRVLASDDPAPQPPLEREWSYGPAHYSPPVLESASNDAPPASPAPEAPNAQTPAAPAPPAEEEPAPPPVVAPAPPPEPADPPAADEPEAAPEESEEAARECATLCFVVELGLL